MTNWFRIDGGPDYEHIFFVYIGVCIVLFLFGNSLLKLAKRKLTEVYPVQPSEFDKVTDNDLHMFCYTCAGERLAENVEVMAGVGKGNLATQCCACGYFVHDAHWLPDLVHIIEEYHEVRREKKSPLPIDPDFPINQFSSFTEETVMLTQCLSSVYNVLTIILRFVQRPDRDSSQRWNMTVILLAWGELIAVVAAVVYTVYKTTRLARQFTRRHPYRVWATIFLSELPVVANYNALSLLRFWDVTLVVSTLQTETYVEHSGPGCWNYWVKLLFLIIRVPGALLMIVLPVVGVLTRLLQLTFIFDLNMKNWQLKDWLVFFGFMNNFRFLASRPHAMKVLGAHLLRDQPTLLFAEVVDAHKNSRYVFSVATLISSGCPSELFQIFKTDSDLWLTLEEVQGPKPPEAGEQTASVLPPKTKKLHANIGPRRQPEGPMILPTGENVVVPINNQFRALKTTAVRRPLRQSVIRQKLELAAAVVHPQPVVQTTGSIQ